MAPGPAGTGVYLSGRRGAGNSNKDRLGLAEEVHREGPCLELGGNRARNSRAGRTATCFGKEA
ncbi:MAG: hypothetical protein ACTSRL_19060 [Candidatus Helarchaeota archaeon]